MKIFVVENMILKVAPKCINLLIYLGMIYLIMYKTPSPYFWENMWADVFYKPKNQYFWFDMQTRFKNSVKETIWMLD